MIIKMLENEYWWGGIVDLGIDMPYCKESDSECDVTTIKLALDQSAPVFVSSKGRYLWSEKPFKATFWHGEIRIPDIYDVVLEKSGDTLKSAQTALYKKYYKQNEIIPNDLYFKTPQYNTWIELGENQTQDGILKYAEGIVKSGLPAGILMIDNGWQNGLGNWRFDLKKIPEPKAMIKRLHELGFVVMLWTIPIVRVSDVNNFDELCENGVIIKNKDNEPILRWWFGGYDYNVDLTSENGAEWYCGQMDALMREYDVDGFKLDGGDVYFYDDGDNTDKEITAHEHTKLFNHLAKKYQFHEFRAGYDCGGYPYVFRLQDKRHTWDDSGLNCVIPNSVVQGLIGHFYHCPDMVGGGSLNELFDECFDTELYIRWVQANALCPMIQFSIAPWRVLSEAQMEITKKMALLHESFGEYILSLAHNAAVTGEPIMRHMSYEFPDEGFEEVDDCFMLGSEILVAPVLKKGQFKTKLRLPKGNWIADDKAEYEGGKEIEIHTPIERLPYFKLK